MEYSTIEELIKLARENKTSISEIVILTEMEESEQSRAEVEGRMLEVLQVMKHGVEEGKSGNLKSASGLIGGEAKQLLGQDRLPQDDLYMNIVVNALAISEVNAGMGKIVAGPTAGSSGIVPGVILAIGDKLKLSDEEICRGLFTASGLGTIIARKATLSGAEGGCQAECGSASAMAAGAAVELYQGTPEMVGDAFALALKNQLGLVCDPVAGLVEVPCVKRNGFSAGHAMTAANMALSGIKSVIPPDEVIEAMNQIGNLLPGSLKETALGGLAATATGLKIKEQLKREE